MHALSGLKYICMSSHQLPPKLLPTCYVTYSELMHGLPEMLVTDNGTAFTSGKFREYVKRNGIRHVTSSPFHPATNGLVECAIQTFKQAMRKITGPMDTRINKFLLTVSHLKPRPINLQLYKLLMLHCTRSQLDLILPGIQQQVCRSMEQQVWLCTMIKFSSLPFSRKKLC